MKYKGYQIERANQSIGIKFYFIAYNNEQIYPNDLVFPQTIKQCKNLINQLISRKDINMTHFEAGVRDHEVGVYDKWFRYHSNDDGYSYDQGWMSVSSDLSVQIIECCF